MLVHVELRELESYQAKNEGNALSAGTADNLYLGAPKLPSSEHRVRKRATSTVHEDSCPR